MLYNAGMFQYTTWNTITDLLAGAALINVDDLIAGAGLSDGSNNWQ
jgi:hypothetical protein